MLLYAVAPTDHELMQWIRQTDMNAYAASKDRLVIVQLMILYYTLMALNIQSEEHFKQMVQQQKDDLPLTWNLLQFSPTAKDIGGTLLSSLF